jgi:hypothetical protein
MLFEWLARLVNRRQLFSSAQQHLGARWSAGRRSPAALLGRVYTGHQAPLGVARDFPGQRHGFPSSHRKKFPLISSALFRGQSAERVAGSASMELIDPTRAQFQVLESLASARGLAGRSRRSS